MTNPTVLAIGDSVFDNGVYLSKRELSTTALLRERLAPLDLDLETRAVDGAMVADAVAQLPEAGEDYHAIVISAGGNDMLTAAMGLMDVQSLSLRDVGDLCVKVEWMASQYRMLVEMACEITSEVICLGVYNPIGHKPNWFAQTNVAHTLNRMTNDAISAAARKAGADYLDLREVCLHPDQFTNVIEPSEQGGADIATAIIHRLQSNGWA